MNAGYIWVGSSDNLFHYTGTSGHFVVSGGLSCSVDCYGHNVAEDSLVDSSDNATNDSSVNTSENDSDNSDANSTNNETHYVTEYASHDTGVCPNDNGTYRYAVKSVERTAEDFLIHSTYNGTYNSGLKTSERVGADVLEDSGDNSSVNGTNHTGYHTNYGVWP